MSANLTTYQVLRVFVSSPGDVPKERLVTGDVLRDVNTTCSDVIGISLDRRTWENMPPLTPQLPEERIQDVIDEQVRQCHVFILVLNKRYGSREPGHKASNTAREVEIALEQLKRHKKLIFLSYFRKLSPNPDRGGQEEDVLILRNRLRQEGVFYREYTTPDEFRTYLTHDLYRTVLTFRLSTPKQKAVRGFFPLGTAERRTLPRLAIIYPTVDRTYMGDSSASKFWQQRLLPNIVFEDFKALEKIQKALRLIGFHDFRIYSVSTIPMDVQYMNRVWLCLKRNNEGMIRLRKYATKARFSFSPRPDGSEAKIEWNSLTAGRVTDRITIQSPLSKYLSVQRTQQAHGEWSSSMGRMIAKDYAILARFPDAQSEINVVDRPLVDYFLTGIRGLGTWGAAWFIDRKYTALTRFEEHEAIQMLLEVTYQDERIIDVHDVSNEPASYFHTQCSTKEVRRTIKQYRERR